MNSSASHLSITIRLRVRAPVNLPPRRLRPWLHLPSVARSITSVACQTPETFLRKALAHSSIIVLLIRQFVYHIESPSLLFLLFLFFSPSSQPHTSSVFTTHLSLSHSLSFFVSLIPKYIIQLNNNHINPPIKRPSNYLHHLVQVHKCSISLFGCPRIRRPPARILSPKPALCNRLLANLASNPLAIILAYNAASSSWCCCLVSSLSFARRLSANSLS